MKTIIVVYSNANKLSNTTIRNAKYYAFNSKANLKVEDIISSSQYDTRMHVVKILDKAYKYYNSLTGELTDNYNSTQLREIKDLIIKENKDEAIYGSIINKNRDK